MPDGAGSPDASALGGMRRLLFLKMVKKTILTLAILWVIFEATVGLYASEHGASDMPWSKDRTDSIGELA